MVDKVELYINFLNVFEDLDLGVHVAKSSNFLGTQYSHPHP